MGEAGAAGGEEGGGLVGDLGGADGGVGGGVLAVGADEFVAFGELEVGFVEVVAGDGEGGLEVVREAHQSSSRASSRYSWIM